MFHSTVKCRYYKSSLDVLASAISEFLARPQRHDGKVLVLVPSAKETTKVMEDLVARGVIKRENIAIAHRNDKTGIVIWCTDLLCWVLVGTTVVGAGVSNLLCDMVVHFNFAYTPVHFVQGFNRSGRDARRGVVPVSMNIFNQNQVDIMCGKRHSYKRRFAEGAVIGAIKVDAKTGLAAVSSSTVTGFEDLVYCDRQCRLTSLGKA